MTSDVSLLEEGVEAVDSDWIVILGIKTSSFLTSPACLFIVQAALTPLLILAALPELSPPLECFFICTLLILVPLPFIW